MVLLVNSVKKKKNSVKIRPPVWKKEEASVKSVIAVSVDNFWLEILDGQSVSGSSCFGAITESFFLFCA